MEAHRSAPSIHAAVPDAATAHAVSLGRLTDRGFDPGQVIGRTDAGAPMDVATFYDILGTLAASEKGGQSPTYAVARLALRSGLPSDIADTLFLAYNQQSAEEAGHGDKVFANAYFSMGGVPPGAERNVFDDGADLEPGDDPSDNERRLCTRAARIGGVETVALQNVFPVISALCEQWDHPIGRDLSLQIRDVIRPEESRHVLLWRYVFHRLIAPKESEGFDAFLHATNEGRSLVGGWTFDRETLQRRLGTSAPTARQLLGKERMLIS